MPANRRPSEVPGRHLRSHRRVFGARVGNSAYPQAGEHRRHPPLHGPAVSKTARASSGSEAPYPGRSTAQTSAFKAFPGGAHAARAIKEGGSWEPCGGCPEEVCSSRAAESPGSAPRQRIKSVLPRSCLCLRLFTPGHTVSGHFPCNVFPRLPPSYSLGRAKTQFYREA